MATPPGATPLVTALVVAGGGSTRFGADKLVQPLGRTTVLHHLLSTLPPGWPVVVVGPRRDGSAGTHRPVTWVREPEPHGGPLAGVAAGLALVRTTLVVVLGGDMPFAAAAAGRVVEALAGAGPEVAAVTARGPDGRVQPLLTAYVSDRARGALPDRTQGGRARALLEALPHLVLDVSADDLLDVDTPDQLATARHRLGP